MRIRTPGSPAGFVLALVSTCLLLSAGARAQDPAPAEPKRPRIGVVLSGGGARGAAHVGVLRVLEELRIPVDFLTGTSMGSVVAGLYAYGLSPKEIEVQLTREGSNLDWDYLLSDGSERRDRSFRRKQDDRGYLTELRVGFRDGRLALPKGLLQGQNLETELRFLTMEAHDLASFDELPIPFRAVACDIANGREVVLDKGNLALAMRASMSIPAIFEPIRIDGKELVDGGLVQNMPVELCRSMGADILIVIDIGTPLAEGEAIRDVLGVTAQMITILTQQNVDRAMKQIRATDTFLQPDLGDMSSADFARASDAILMGEKAARGIAGRLAQHSLDEQQYAAWLAKQRRRPLDPPRIRSIELHNDSTLGDEMLEARLRVKEGDVIDVDHFRRDIQNIYGLGDFDEVSFSLRNWKDGEADLEIDADERRWGPNYIRMGVLMYTDFDGESRFDIGVQYTSRAINSLGAEWRNDIQVGTANSYTTEFYQPLDVRGRFFVAPSLGAGIRPFRFYQGDSLVAAGDTNSLSGSFDVGMNLARWGELRVGVDRSYGDYDVKITTNVVSNTNFDDAAVHAQLLYDTLDKASVPTEGSAASAGWRSGMSELGSDRRYDQVQLSAVKFVTFGQTTVFPLARVQVVTDGEVGFENFGLIGGLFRLSGLPIDSRGNQNAGVFTLGLRHMLYTRVFLGASIEAGNVWATRDEVFDSNIVSWSLHGGVDTPAGPLYVGGGFTDEGDAAAFLFLGEIF